jgi:hypothetical protein
MRCVQANSLQYEPRLCLPSWPPPNQRGRHVSTLPRFLVLRRRSRFRVGAMVELSGGAAEAGVDRQRAENGDIYIWLDPGVLANLKALRGWRELQRRDPEAGER